jgi:hypothetical protein
MLARAFAGDLSKHTLKKKMTAEQILALLNISNISATPTSTPGTKQTVAPEYDGDLDDMPKDIGLSKARAEAVLALCQMGVPDEHYVHAERKKVFKPTKQHKDFYFDDNSRIAGPKGKDGKEKKVIKWLAKKAGKVGPPPEEEVVAALPPKWNGDKKKVRNMLSKVEERKKDGYINWASSREVQKKDDESKDDKIYDDNYMICGEKKDKVTFLNLVAWLDEHPEIQEPEKDDKPAKANKKGKKANKKGKKDIDSDSSKDIDSDSSKDSDSSDKSESSKDSDDESSKKDESSKDKSDSSSSDSSDDDEDKDDKLSEEDKDDGTSSSDDDEDDDSGVSLFIEGYDQKKLDALKKALEKRGDKEFVNVDTRKTLKPTNKTKNTHYFNSKSGLAIKKCDTKEETKAKFDAVLKMVE